MDIASEVLGEFEAGQYSVPKDVWSNFKFIGKTILKDQFKFDENLAVNQRKNDFAVDSRNIKLHYLYQDVINEPSMENQQKLMKELAHRLSIDELFQKLFPNFIQDVKDKKTPPIDDFDCYRNLINEYKEKCGEYDVYTMKYFGAFASQCTAQKYYPQAKEAISKAMDIHCSKKVEDAI